MGETFTRTLPVELEPEERAARGVILAQKYQKLAELERKKKHFAAAYKAEREDLEAEVAELSRAVSTGYEDRAVPCRETIDRFSRVARIRRVDTGEMIDTRPLSRDEIEGRAAEPEKQPGLFPAAGPTPETNPPGDDDDDGGEELAPGALGGGTVAEAFDDMSPAELAGALSGAEEPPPLLPDSELDRVEGELAAAAEELLDDLGEPAPAGEPGEVVGVALAPAEPGEVATMQSTPAELAGVTKLAAPLFRGEVAADPGPYATHAADWLSVGDLELTDAGRAEITAYRTALARAIKIVAGGEELPEERPGALLPGGCPACKTPISDRELLSHWCLLGRALLGSYRGAVGQLQTPELKGYVGPAIEGALFRSKRGLPLDAAHWYLCPDCREFVSELGLLSHGCLYITTARAEASQRADAAEAAGVVKVQRKGGGKRVAGRGPK